tara:strand:+ start:2601 stop:2792 length:192 start_codon:yes stop_codon:yes gene_type:complete
MKKISLKSVKEHLTRDEMRVISGGSVGSGSCYCPNSDRSYSVVSCSSNECEHWCAGETWICTG